MLDKETYTRYSNAVELDILNFGMFYELSRNGWRDIVMPFRYATDDNFKWSRLSERNHTTFTTLWEVDKRNLWRKLYHSELSHTSRKLHTGHATRIFTIHHHLKASRNWQWSFKKIWQTRAVWFLLRHSGMKLKQLETSLGFNYKHQ